MIILCKMTATSVNLLDAVKQEDKLRSREKLYAIKDMPCLLDYLGYMFFCGGCIIGPYYEYKDFDDFINRRDYYGRMKKGSTLVPALIRMGQGALVNVIS